VRVRPAVRRPDWPRRRTRTIRRASSTARSVSNRWPLDESQGPSLLSAPSPDLNSLVSPSVASNTPRPCANGIRLAMPWPIKPSALPRARARPRSRPRLPRTRPPEGGAAQPWLEVRSHLGCLGQSESWSTLRGGPTLAWSASVWPRLPRRAFCGLGHPEKWGHQDHRWEVLWPPAFHSRPALAPAARVETPPARAAVLHVTC